MVTEIVFKHMIEVLCAGFMFIATWFFQRMYKRFFKDQESLRESVLAINYDRLRQACRYHLSRNKISPEELKNLEYLYKGYHALGGNGTGTELYKRCQKLEIEVEDGKNENKLESQM